MYIIVLDPEGATLGYDGEYVTINHRVLVEKENMYGYESLQRLFKTIDELRAFLMLIARTPTGTYGRLSWHHEQ